MSKRNLKTQTTILDPSKGASVKNILLSWGPTLMSMEKTLEPEKYIQLSQSLTS